MENLAVVIGSRYNLSRTMPAPLPHRASPYRAVIFDLDGVLVDSEPLWKQVISDLLAAYGKDYPRSLQLRSLGLTGSAFGKLLVEELSLDEDPESLTRERDRRALTYLSRSVSSFPDTCNLLRSLARSTTPLAVATSTPRFLAESLLRRLELRHHLVALVTGDDVEHGKPKPEPYQQASRLLGVPPENCIVIEDSPAGVSSAVEAGCYCIALATTTSVTALQRADRIVADLADLAGTVLPLLALPPTIACPSGRMLRT